MEHRIIKYRAWLASEKEMDMLFKNVQQLVKQKIDFDTLSSAKSKLNNFLTQ